MKRSMWTGTSLVTLFSFGALALAPRLAAADETGGVAFEPTHVVVRSASPAISPQQDLGEGDDRATAAETLTLRAPLLAQYAPPPQPGYYPPAQPQQPPPPGYYQQPPPGYYQQPPPGYYQQAPAGKIIVGYEDRPRWGLFGAGMGVFGAFYLSTVFFGAIPAGKASLAVPVVGPLFYLNSYQNSSENAFVNSVLVFDTLVQAAGMAMIIAGLVAKKRVPIYQRVSVVPTATPTYAGLSAFGLF